MLRVLKQELPIGLQIAKKLYLILEKSGHPEVYIVDISERMPRKLLTNVSDMSAPSWSQDGKWIYFQSSSTDIPTVRIFRSPASGGDAVVLPAGFGVGPLESYDEKTLYFANIGNLSAIHTVSLGTPGAESVLRGMPVGFHQWTLVPGGIYFVSSTAANSSRQFSFDTPADAPRTVWYFDFGTKQVRQIFKAEKVFNSGLSISPDGLWILYTQEDQGSSDIMLVDHFQ
jgi:Tol biopolymer transport system component